MAFEDSLRTQITVGVSDPPETDLEYYARPENYTGSNMLAMQRVVMAHKRQANSDKEEDRDRTQHERAFDRLIDRYKDIGASWPNSLQSPTEDKDFSSMSASEKQQGIIAILQDNANRRRSLSRRGRKGSLGDELRCPSPRDKWKQLTTLKLGASRTPSALSDADGDHLCHTTPHSRLAKSPTLYMTSEFAKAQVRYMAGFLPKSSGTLQLSVCRAPTSFCFNQKICTSVTYF